MRVILGKCARPRGGTHVAPASCGTTLRAKRAAPLNEYVVSRRLIKTVSPSAKHVRRLGDERGFSLLQILIVLAITGVVAGFSVFGIRSARSSTRLNNSARAFAQTAERARLDAIRRRTTTHVEFTDSNTYEISMDFTGVGTPQTRTFTLDTGVVVTDDNGNTLTSSSDSLPYADFDWRGRTYECNMLFNLKNDRGDRLTVQVAGSGDISVNSAVTGLPTITYTNVNSTSDVNPSAALTGNDNKLNLSPCGTSSTVPSGGSCTNCTQGCAGGSITPSSTYISDLKRSGGNSRTVTMTVTAPGSITAAPDSNLSVSPSAAQSITSSTGGSVTYTIRSTNKSMGTYTVKFYYSSCTNAVVSVSVKVTK
jgi:Tfp pilus assembly protein FimT